MNKEEELLQKFKEVHPKLIDDILGCPELKEVSIVREWYRKVFEYNTAGGKLNRGLLVVQCYLSMVEKCQINDENTHLACVLGWCLEMLQSWLLVIDDLMDNSSTRRGKPCWYLTNDLGTKAANDGLIIEAATYYILKKYFRNKPYYVDVLELFHSVTFQTTLGQCLDTHSYLTNGKLDFDKTSMDLFLQIAKYKTAYYTLYMPIALGMLMARQNDTDLLKAIENTVIPIGIYFQVQDDYLDCFGDPSTTGKIGTDIQDGKCTWLLAKALELGTPEQVALIKKNYGKDDAESISKVKEVYTKIGMNGIYSDYEEKTYKEAVSAIESLPSSVSHEPFWGILRKIYKRER
ncbi:uncharacterized protein LOC136025231 [Artemia franciscana]|uniref:uncharacterized protein LOC136025231 n=1 Tax=Artemia franciscana TaxID=6661 RepID=UPI0032DAF3D0